jgi:2-phosphosulfolactate phosphatase
MKIEVAFTIAEATNSDLADAAVIVVDVIRASTTIISALAAGAAGIYPAGSHEDAVRLVQSLGRGDTILAGERRGLPIDGYQLGNSPAEFTPKAVAGKRVILNTTNGTRALVAAEPAERVLVGAFVNLSAVVASVASASRVLMLCAGRENRFALDDAVCAGRMVARLKEVASTSPVLGEGAHAALELALSHPIDEGFLARTEAGQALIDIALGQDLVQCAALDAFDVVPQMHERVVRRAHGD